MTIDPEALRLARDYTDQRLRFGAASDARMLARALLSAQAELSAYTAASEALHLARTAEMEALMAKLNAAQAEIERLTHERAWQPIETAPRRWVPPLSIYSDAGPEIWLWCGPFEQSKGIGKRALGGTRATLAGFLGTEPTHWLPEGALPPLPEAEQETPR